MQLKFWIECSQTILTAAWCQARSAAEALSKKVMSIWDNDILAPNEFRWWFDGTNESCATSIRRLPCASTILRALLNVYESDALHWLLSYPILCTVLLCFDLLCFALLCLALPCLALPCLALPCLASLRFGLLWFVWWFYSIRLRLYLIFCFFCLPAEQTKYKPWRRLNLSGYSCDFTRFESVHLIYCLHTQPN